MREDISPKPAIAPEPELLGLPFAAAIYPMLVFDRENYAILDVNNVALKQYGYSRQEFLSLTVLDLRPSEELSKFRSLVLDRRREEPFTAARWRHKTKNSTVFQVSITSWKIKFRGRDAELVLARPEL